MGSNTGRQLKDKPQLFFSEGVTEPGASGASESYSLAINELSVETTDGGRGDIRYDTLTTLSSISSFVSSLRGSSE